MGKMKNNIERAEQLTRLKDFKDSVLKNGFKIIPIGSIKHISQSGTIRHISFCIPYYENNRIQYYNLNYAICRILEYKESKNYDVVVGGCGMDMIFHTLYNLNNEFKREFNENLFETQEYKNI